MTNFPNGVASFGVPVLPGVDSDVGPRSGNVWWVDSGYASGPGNGTFAKPFLTVAAAVDKATATNGDTIYVKDGHAETFSAAVSTWAKAGVAIIGLGNGGTRPTFTMGTATTVNIALSSANMILKNLLFNTTFDAVVAVVTISAADVQILDCEFRDNAATTEAAIDILTTAAADRLTIKSKHTGFGTGDAKTDGIQLIGVVDAKIDIDFYGLASAGVVNMTTTVCQDIRITGRVQQFATGQDLVIVHTSALAHVYEAVVYDGRVGGLMMKSNQQSALAAFPDICYQPYAPGSAILVASQDDQTVGTTVGTVFRVVGQVLIESLYGEVTTTLNNDAGTLTIGYGSTTPQQFVSVTTIATTAAGTLLALPFAATETFTIGSAGALMLTNAAASTATINAMQTIVVGGTAVTDRIVTTRDGVASAGVIAWRLRYKPLTTGARVVPTPNL